MRGDKRGGEGDCVEHAGRARLYDEINRRSLSGDESGEEVEGRRRDHDDETIHERAVPFQQVVEHGAARHRHERLGSLDAEPRAASRGRYD
jgi:hypothetical protein